METSSDLTLRLAVAAWRASLPAMPTDDIAELESHLLDSTAELQKTGLSASEAFLIARRRLGDLSDLVEDAHAVSALPQPIAAAKTITTRIRSAKGERARLLSTVGALALLVAIGIPLWLKFTPYSANVMLEILRTSTILDFGQFKSAPAPSESPSKEFFATQFRIVTATETLMRVVKKLALHERWRLRDQNQAVQRLRKMVSANAETDTNLIRITVHSRDKKEVRELAEEVANGYIERRKKLEQERVDLALVSLTQSRKGQEMVVDKMQKKMQDAASEFNISDPAPDGPLYTEPSTSKVGPAPAAAYNKAKTQYQLQSKILAEMVQAQEDARLTNLMPRSPATFHEHATEPPDHSFLNSPFWWGLSGGCGLLGAVLLVLGLRRKPCPEVEVGNYTVRRALA